MFNIVEYGTIIPLVVLNDNLDNIETSNSPETKKLIQGFIDHGFSVLSESFTGKTLNSDQSLQIILESSKIHIFQEFLQNTHTLDIIQGK